MQGDQRYIEYILKKDHCNQCYQLSLITILCINPGISIKQKTANMGIKVCNNVFS